MPLDNMKNRCTAHNKRTGERCQSPAVTGYTVCYHHGANPTNRGGRPKGCKKAPGSGGPPPKGNQNGWKHGAYSSRLLPDELEMYEQIRQEFAEELGADNLTTSDKRLIHQLAVVSTKFDTAAEKGAPPEALHMLNRMILELLRELKITRASKDGGGATGTTPAEVMAALYMKVTGGKQVDPAHSLAPNSGELLDAMSDNNASGQNSEP